MFRTDGLDSCFTKSTLATLLFLLPCAASATTYKHFPGTPLRLGAGFDPVQPDRAFLPCVNGSPTEAKDTPAESTEFSITEIKTRRDLYRHLHIDATLAATFTFGSGGASFSLDEKYQFSSDNMYFAVKAGSDYYTVTFNNPTLTAEARTLLNSPQAFHARCGVEYVAQERRTSEVVAILAFERVTASQQKHLAAAMNASGFGFDFTGSYEETIANSTDKIILNVSVYAVGGTGVTVLADLTEIPATVTSVTALKLVLKKYVTTMTSNSAIPVEYVTAYWSSFGVPVEPRIMDKRSLVLPEIYFSYRDNETTLRKLGELIRHAADPTSTLKPADVEAYQRQYRELAGELMHLASEGRACVQAEARCDPIPAPLVYKVSWPQAVYQKQFVRVDNMNRPYTIASTIHTIGWGGNATGTISIPADQEARVYDVKYDCEGYGCGWSYNPDGGYAAKFSVTGQVVTWTRYWQGEACTNKYTVYYEVARDVCIANCNYLRTYQQADGSRSQKSPDAEFASVLEKAGLSGTPAKRGTQEGSAKALAARRDRTPPGLKEQPRVEKPEVKK